MIVHEENGCFDKMDVSKAPEVSLTNCIFLVGFKCHCLFKEISVGEILVIVIAKIT